MFWPCKSQHFHPFLRQPPVRRAGFTLAELLIGVGLMALLATLAIPALLNQGGKTQANVATVKEAALSIAAAFSQYKLTSESGTLPGIIQSALNDEVDGIDTKFETDFSVGDQIRIGSETRTITSIFTNTDLRVTPNFSSMSFVPYYKAGSSSTGYTNFKFASILSSLTYLKTDTATNASSVPTGETALQACSSTRPCLQLHNGALLQYHTSNTFGGNSPLNYVLLAIDPDGAGSLAGKVNLVLYSNGKVVSYDQLISGSVTSGTTLTASANPAWLTTAEFGR